MAGEVDDGFDRSSPADWDGLVVVASASENPRFTGEDLDQHLRDGVDQWGGRYG